MTRISQVAELIAINIRKARLSAGLTQAELAAMMGVPRPSLSRWERGRMPDAETLLAICQAVEISPSEILGLTEEPFLICARLKRLFSAEGISLAANITKIPESTLELVTEGKLFLPRNTLERIAGAYQVAYRWLLTGNPALWSPSLDGGIGARLRFTRIIYGLNLNAILPEESEQEVFRAIEKSEAFAAIEMIDGGESNLARWQPTISAMMATMDGPTNSAIPWGMDWNAWLKTGKRSNS